MIIGNPITLRASKVIADLTTFINELKLIRNINTTSIVKSLVDAFKSEKVDTGAGITYTFYTDLLDVYDLSNKSTLLDENRGEPKMHQETITIDKYKMIPIKWSEELSRDAVTSGNLVSSFLNYVYDLGLRTKDYYLFDECLACLKKFYEDANLRETQKVKIVRAKAEPGAGQLELNAVDEINTRNLAKKVRIISNNMKVKTKDYNEYDKDGNGAYNADDTGDTVLFVSDTAWTDFLADTMASLYHADKVGEMIDAGKIVLIPENTVAKIAGEGAKDFIGILASSNKFQKPEFYNLSYDFFDPSTLYKRWFLHFAYTVDYFKTPNAVIFTYSDN